MGKMLGLNHKGEHDEAGAAGPSSGAAKRKAGQTQAQADDDARLRFTITAGGRRMSKAAFIDQIRHMDPKSRVQAVENSDAPEGVKHEARKDAREHAAGNQATVPVIPKHPQEEHRRSDAALHPVASHESGDLKLVDSNEQDIPFHDLSSELRRFQMQSASGETAAERRRRQALQQQSPDEDSEDDGTERVPPAPHAEPPPRERIASDTGETAAERRRREGALGLRDEEESDSDEDDEPRQVPQTQNIRFADEAPPPRSRGRQGRQSTLKWGKDVGRE